MKKISHLQIITLLHILIKNPQAKKFMKFQRN